MSSPTLIDVMQSLGAIKTDLNEVKKQVKKTNGRVNKLEQAEISRSAVEEYVKEHPTTRIKAETVNMQKNVWNDPKLVSAIIALLTACAGYLIFLSTKGGL